MGQEEAACIRNSWSHQGEQTFCCTSIEEKWRDITNINTLMLCLRTSMDYGTRRLIQALLRNGKHHCSAWTSVPYILSCYIRSVEINWKGSHNATQSEGKFKFKLFKIKLKGTSMEQVCRYIFADLDCHWHLLFLQTQVLNHTNKEVKYLHVPEQNKNISSQSDFRRALHVYWPAKAVKHPKYGSQSTTNNKYSPCKKYPQCQIVQTENI